MPITLRITFLGMTVMSSANRIFPLKVPQVSEPKWRTNFIRLATACRISTMSSQYQSYSDVNIPVRHRPRGQRKPLPNNQDSPGKLNTQVASAKFATPAKF